MTRLKDAAGSFFWNALMAAVVFLPVFMVLAWLQILWKVGPPRNTTFAVEVSNWFYFYLLMVFPLIFGSIVYTLAVIFLPRDWNSSRRRLFAIFFAPILPVVVWIFNLPGGLVYLPFFAPTLMAIILYGASVRLVRGNN